jgi:predicted porin
MKFNYTALALLSVLTTSAYAQSSVNIYGIVDLSIRRASGLTDFAPNGGSWTGLSSGVDSTSRLGFRIKEDLGGGLSALAQLESGYNFDSGTTVSSTIFFDRQSWVGLGSPWGTVTAGRQTSLLADAISPIDPLGMRLASFNPSINVAALSQHGLGIGFGPSGSTTASYRLNNSIKYAAELSGVTLRLMHGFGEVVDNNAALSSNGIGAGYKIGGLVLSAAYQTFKNSTDLLTLRGSVLGAAYTFGDFRVAGIYGRSRGETSATARTDFTTLGLGGTMPLTKEIDFTLAHYKVERERTGRTEDGYSRSVAFAEYKFSKRTTAYLEADHTRWRSGFQGAGNRSRGTGFGGGVRHTF